MAFAARTGSFGTGGARWSSAASRFEAVASGANESDALAGLQIGVAEVRRDRRNRRLRIWQPAFSAQGVRAGARECGLSASIVTVTADPDVVRAAERVVLPGVGAFADCRTGCRRSPA